jgi:hypothetical protein
MVTLLLLGAIFPIHIARAWRGRLDHGHLQRRADPDEAVVMDKVTEASTVGASRLWRDQGKV